MPHFIIEYSGNLDARVNMSALCEHIRKHAEKIDTFPVGGIRVRAIRAEYFAIADGNKNHAFVDISIRLRAGRPPEVKQAAAQKIFNAAEEFLADDIKNNSLALSLEMRDIDPKLSPKISSIRQHM